MVGELDLDRYSPFTPEMQGEPGVEPAPGGGPVAAEVGERSGLMVVRNGLRAVAVGSGQDGSIDIPFMPVSADVQNGDVFVTSGIDGTYPPGLVVAEVTSVQKNAAYVFAKISAKPMAGVDNHRYVMVLPLSAASIARPESKPDEQPRKGAKDRARPRRQ